MSMNQPAIPDAGRSALTARVVGLFTAVSAGAPVSSHDWVMVTPGHGIEGDRYAAGRGHWSDPRWPDQELTLVEAEVAAALGMDAGALRRNIVTEGVRLGDLIGRRFEVGGVTLYGVRLCDPCAYLDSLTRLGVAHALKGRGGLRARALEGGRLHIGDPIRLLPPETP